MNTHTHKRTYAFTYAQTHMHTHKCTHTFTHTHTHTHTHIHTHTHVHTRTYVETQMTAFLTMPQCCRCNGSGRSVSCACARAKKDCTICLPSKRSRCSNNVPPQNIPQLSRSLCTEVMPEVNLEVVQETLS